MGVSSEEIKIYTLGDSHSWHAWLNIPEVTVKTIGPMTMHGMATGSSFGLKEIPKGSYLICCWGEIDCRCHVHNHQPWQECINKLVEGYLEKIKEFAKDYKVILFNVVPPPKAEKVVEKWGGKDFPFVGSNEVRLQYVKYMNKKLKESGYPFIDVYDHYCDEDGFMLDGNVHIKDEQPLIDWLTKNKVGV